MRKCYLVFVFLFTVSVLFLSVRVTADEVSPESTPAVTAESAAPSTEAIPAVTVEATPLPSTEVSAATTEVSTAEPAAAGTEEGASYKGIPWGADFNAFKAVKGFAGNLGPLSAAFVGTADDNDIAMLLGVPVSDKGSNGGQRVLFEYMPRKFASVCFEPDDTHYIFYNGKFAMTFSKINSENFDLYRDTFYKKYKKSGSFAKRYEPTAKQSYLLQASIFEKGRTSAFLIKTQLTVGKKSFISTKLIFAFNGSLETIRKEIDDKLAAEQLSSGEKEIKQLEKDLNKIE
jgi:hypothetical protein